MDGDEGARPFVGFGLSGAAEFDEEEAVGRRGGAGDRREIFVCGGGRRGGRPSMPSRPMGLWFED